MTEEEEGTEETEKIILAANIDDFIKMMEEADREDKIDHQTLARPIEYARSRGLRPQRVYKALGEKKLEGRMCDCGHMCVNIQEADEFFKPKNPNAPKNID